MGHILLQTVAKTVGNRDSTDAFRCFRSGDNILFAEALIALVHRQGLLLEVDVRRCECQQLSLPNPRVVHGHEYRVAGGTVFHALDKCLELVLCPEQHLTVTQFKVQQEQARLAEFTEQNRQQEKQAATLGSKIEKIQNQRVDVRSIEKIVATSIPFSSKVAVEREDFDRLSTLAKKYVTAEKKESKLQKALDAANKLIAKLKAEIDGLKQEISDYKSVRGKLRAAELERENTELRGKVRSYEDVIQRNNLWRFFHPHREKAVTRDEAR